MAQRTIVMRAALRTYHKAKSHGWRVLWTGNGLIALHKSTKAVK